MTFPFTDRGLLVRSAEPDDRRRLASLIHFGPRVHRHLDWRPPLDWIGRQPFMLTERSGHLVAALACPPDAETVSWIRLFAVGTQEDPLDIWDLLWNSALKQLPAEVNGIAAIPMQSWFANILDRRGFQRTHQIILLTRKLETPPDRPEMEGFRIRLMNQDDLRTVQALDAEAFEPIWRNSMDSLEIAFHQAAIATVAESDQGIIGYQISTASAAGGHLARLAVKPDIQSHGIGYALVSDLLCQFQRRGALSVTVNTQEDNCASLSLYERAGFEKSGDCFSVFQFDLQSG